MKKGISIFKKRNRNFKEETLPKDFLDNYKKEIEKALPKYIQEDEKRGIETIKAAKKIAVG